MESTRSRAFRLIVLTALLGLAASSVAISAARQAGAGTSPIRHVVVIMMENRTFDNVLGALCAERVASGDPAPCDGATSGETSTGSVISLALAPDVQTPLNHSVQSHLLGLNYQGGVARMNGFDRIDGCSPTGSPPYACYDQYDPQGADASDIANITTLANRYAISDRTFESYTSASWVSHLEMVSGTRDQFHGDNPFYIRANNPPPHGPGWGCPSNDDAPYDSPSGVIFVPSCVPDQGGNGPYRASPVSYVPTIFDRLDAAGLGYTVYVHHITAPKSPCSYFWECYNGSQASHTVDVSKFAANASAGTLPAVSYVIPRDTYSTHPTFSMTAGDDWLGQQVSAVENGPDWSSTAMFITWDDCGCFYDHVAPPSQGMGLRVPMLIVSPYAKAHYVDSTDATIASALAYIESTFNLPPLGPEDSGTYDFANAFDYSQAPLPPARMVHAPLPPSTVRYLASHPGQHEPS